MTVVSPPTLDPKRRFGRRLIMVIGGCSFVLAGLAAAGLWELSRANFASFATNWLTTTTGRKTTVGALRITPGSWLAVDLDDVHIANIPGGSRPDMFTLTHAHLEIRVTSLLWGPAELRNVALDGFSGLFERTRTRERNWRFSSHDAVKSSRQAAKTPGMNGFPGLRSVHISDSEIIYRSSRGNSYVSTLADVVIASKTDDMPVTMKVAGAYNAVPVALNITLQPLDALRHAEKPFGLNLTATSGDLAIHLEGTTTDLLNFDGIDGSLNLKTPTCTPLMAIAGEAPAPLKASLSLGGHFVHKGDLWSLSRTVGEVRGNPLAATNLTFREGAVGQPDTISGALSFSRLDLNTLLAGNSTDGPSGKGETDIPLVVDSHPDPLLDVSLSATHVRYNTLEFDGASLVLKREPDEIKIPSFRVGWLGAAIHASGDLRAGTGGANLQASASVESADIDRFRRQAGLAALPLSGKLDIRVHLTSGPVKTLNQAAQDAHIVAGVGMSSGALSREVIGMAQENLALLFRRPRGTEPVSCLLGFMIMDHGRGGVRPLRLRTGSGVLYGEANFDLQRKWFELVFASHGASATFAMEIPVMVSGSFASPGVGLAAWSKRGQMLLKDAERDMLVPEVLKGFHAGSPCLREPL